MFISREKESLTRANFQVHHLESLLPVTCVVTWWRTVPCSDKFKIHTAILTCTCECRLQSLPYSYKICIALYVHACACNCMHMQLQLARVYTQVSLSFWLHGTAHAVLLVTLHHLFLPRSEQKKLIVSKLNSRVLCHNLIRRLLWLGYSHLYTN